MHTKIHGIQIGSHIINKNKKDRPFMNENNSFQMSLFLLYLKSYNHYMYLSYLILNFKLRQFALI